MTDTTSPARPVAMEPNDVLVKAVDDILTMFEQNDVTFPPFNLRDGVTVILNHLESSGYRIVRADAALDAGRGVTLTEAERDLIDRVAATAEYAINEGWIWSGNQCSFDDIDAIRALAAGDS